MAALKHCEYCGVEFSAYHRRTKFCLDCRGPADTRRKTAWAEANPEKRTEASRKYNEKTAGQKALSAFERKCRHPQKELLRRCKSRAKEAGLPFDLEFHDIPIPARCPLLGIPLTPFGAGRRGPAQDSCPSVDRLVPSKGYVKGNVWVVSLRANRIKNDSTVDELEKILTALKTGPFQS